MLFLQKFHEESCSKIDFTEFFAKSASIFLFFSTLCFVRNYYVLSYGNACGRSITDQLHVMLERTTNTHVYHIVYYVLRTILHTNIFIFTIVFTNILQRILYYALF